MEHISLIRSVSRALCYVFYDMCPVCYVVYFLFARVLMHLVQARTLFPAKGLNALRVVFSGTLSHCRLGYLLVLVLGLYFPRSFSLFLKG
jgi:hypothetical protein